MSNESRQGIEARVVSNILQGVETAKTQLQKEPQEKVSFTIPDLSGVIFYFFADTVEGDPHVELLDRMSVDSEGAEQHIEGEVFEIDVILSLANQAYGSLVA